MTFIIRCLVAINYIREGNKTYGKFMTVIQGNSGASLELLWAVKVASQYRITRGYGIHSEAILEGGGGGGGGGS